jgi:uncharacterized membrane protein YccC
MSETAELSRPGWRLVPEMPRLVDEAECIVSVLLAILIAHLIGARNVAWAAFSGYMVMRGHVADSVLRGGLRIAGTVLGAALGLAIVPLVWQSCALASLACAAVGGATLYGALTGRRAYAWLFVGLTFEMILLDKLAHPADAVPAFARTRMLEVVAGTLACIAVSSLSALTARRIWPGRRAEKPRRIGWHPHALRHSLQAMVALALLPVLWALFRVPELEQGAVSIMAVMLVPLSALGTSGLKPVSRKLLQRVAGCLAGSALAGFVLVAAHGNPAVLIAGTALGVLVGRHIENGRHGITYVGTQFTLAILVTLVPDRYGDAAIAPAIERLTGILVGLALLEPVLLAWHVLAGGARPATAEG